MTNEGSGPRGGGDDAPVLRWRVGRRRLLALGAGGVAVAATPGPLRSVLLPPLDPLLDALLGEVAYATPPDLTVRLLRPSDQVRLTFEFVNLQRNGAILEKINNANPAFMRVIFGSQHTTEPAPASTFVMPANTAGPSLSADPSRLVFFVDPPIDFTVDKLLDFATFNLSLDNRSDPAAPNSAVGTAPSDDVTAIEIPTGLILSPAGGSNRFTAEQAPITHNDVTELWRARLGVRSGANLLEPPDATPTVRAIYNALSFDPFASIPIDLIERGDLVNAMANYGDTVLYPNHEAAEVGQLWLTSSGGFLDLAAEWDGGTGNISSWIHRALTGRDVLVRITKRGRLAPFGHKANIVEVTERVYKDDSGGNPVAILVKTEYLSISQRTRTFPDASDYMPYEGRHLPFVSVSAATPGGGKFLSPFLSAGPQVRVGQKQVTWTNSQGQAKSLNLNNAWLVTEYVDGTGDPLLQIQFSGVDRHGQVSEWEMPVVFVEESNAFAMGNNTPPTNLREYYADSESNSIRTPEFGDQSVGWTDHNPSSPGKNSASTSKKTDRIRFTLDAPAGNPTKQELTAADTPAFFPAVERAWVRDETLDSLTAGGGTGRFHARTAGLGDTGTHEVVISTDFLTNGTKGPNKGGRYLDLTVAITASQSTNTRSMLQPDVNVEAFSIALGAGGDPPPNNGTFDIENALKSGAKILGTYLLTDLIEAITNVKSPNTDARLPRYSVKTVPGTNALDPPKEITHEFTWKPPLKSLKVNNKYTFVIAKDLTKADLPNVVKGPTEAEITLTQTISALSDAAVDTTLDVVIRDFGVIVPPILPIVGLVLSKLRFIDDNGAESLDLTIEAFTFVGPLNFMDVMNPFLEKIGGEATIHIDEEGIEAQITVTLPDIAFGIVSLTNLKVGVLIEIPFDEDPPFIRFNIGTRNDPVKISVLGIGGSSYFIVGISPKPENPGLGGIVELEFSIAFLMELSASVIIVSAAISASIGLILELEASGETTLTGFLRLEGVIKVIGIELLNIGAEATLKYNLTTKLVTAGIEVWVDAGIFGEKNEWIDAEIELGEIGSGAVHGLGAPAAALNRASFGDRYTDNQWEEYCDAFA